MFILAPIAAALAMAPAITRFASASVKVMLVAPISIQQEARGRCIAPEIYSLPRTLEAIHCGLQERFAAPPTPPYSRDEASQSRRISAHQPDDDGGERHHAPLAPGGEPCIERVDRRRADDGRNERAQSADHDHDDDAWHLAEVDDRGSEGEDIMGIERAAEPCHGTGRDEGEKLHPRDVDGQRLRAHRIVPDGTHEIADR